jgi:hypothetical protein
MLSCGGHSVHVPSSTVLPEQSRPAVEVCKEYLKFNAQSNCILYIGVLLTLVVFCGRRVLIMGVHAVA